MYAPIAIADPRIGAAAGNAAQRKALASETIKAATAALKPDWDATDIVMTRYAQAIDNFGGGGTEVTLKDGSTKSVRVTVVDIATPFDVACQELGPSFGLSHEIDTQGSEYACPFSVLSA